MRGGGSSAVVLWLYCIRTYILTVLSALLSLFRNVKSTSLEAQCSSYIKELQVGVL